MIWFIVGFVVAAIGYDIYLLGPFVNGGEFLTRWPSHTLLKQRYFSVAAGLLL